MLLTAPSQAAYYISMANFEINDPYGDYQDMNSDPSDADQPAFEGDGDYEDELLLTSDEHRGADTYGDFEDAPDADPYGLDLDMPPPIEEWGIVPYASLRDVELQPYQIIDGVPMLSAFNKVEEEICRNVSRVQGDAATVISHETDIVNNRIERTLRPTDFRGALLHGQALVLPFNAETAISHDVRMGKILTPQRMEDNPPQGFNIVYSGLFRSSYSGVLGRLSVETTYFDPRATSRDYRARRDGSNYVKRTIGGTQTIDDAREAVQYNVYASATNALRLLRRNTGLHLGRYTPWRADRQHPPAAA